MKKLLILLILVAGCLSKDPLTEIQDANQNLLGTWRGGFYSTVYDPAQDGTIDDEIRFTITGIDGDSVRITDVVNYKPWCDEDPMCSYGNWTYKGGTIDGKQLALWFSANKNNQYKMDFKFTGNTLSGPVIYSTGDVVYTWMDFCELIKQP